MAQTPLGREGGRALGVVVFASTDKIFARDFVVRYEEFKVGVMLR